MLRAGSGPVVNAAASKKIIPPAAIREKLGRTERMRSVDAETTLVENARMSVARRALISSQLDAGKDDVQARAFPLPRVRREWRNADVMIGGGGSVNRASRELAALAVLQDLAPQLCRRSRKPLTPRCVPSA